MEADGLTSRALEAYGTILAGCSAATTVARLVLLRLLRQTQSAFPSLNMWSVVDDLSCQTAGRSNAVSLVLGGAGNMLVNSVAALKLPLAEKKCKFRLSSEAVSTMLKNKWEGKEFQQAHRCEQRQSTQDGGCEVSHQC